MKYYPINLNVSDKHVLVVGGGAVGVRKAQTLLDCGAFVTMVSPQFSPEVASLSPAKRLTMKEHVFEEADLNGMFLVISATDDMALNRHISRLAHERQMLCNIADVPDACNFILPSILRQGDFTLTISTNGKSPAFSKAMRKQLTSQFGPEYDFFLTLMGAIRQKLLAKEHAPEEHKPLFNQLIQADLVGKIAQADIDAIDNTLTSVLGEGYTLSHLCPTLCSHLATQKKETS